jgi:glycosyltransferase involved in cell wall biosynthesis
VLIAIYPLLEKSDVSCPYALLSEDIETCPTSLIFMIRSQSLMSTYTYFAHQSSDGRKPRLSIVIPVYNEAKAIGPMIRKIKQVVESAAIQPPLLYEIVVVDDGSCDNTFAILEAMQKEDPHLRAISYKPNRGKGYAIKMGIMASAGEIVILIDVSLDLELSPQLIANYYYELDDSCDLAIGSKKHPLSKVNLSGSRTFLSTAFRFVSKELVGIKEISDTQVGLKIGKGELLRRIFEITTVRRYAFDVEFLMIALMLNANIRELPVILKRNEKRFRIVEVARMFTDIVKISYRYRIKHWYQKKLKEPGLYMGEDLHKQIQFH